MTGLETSIPNRNFSRSAGLIIYMDNVALSEVFWPFFNFPNNVLQLFINKNKKTLSRV